MQLTATWLTGPDSGRRHSVARGSTIIGTAGLRCDDPDLLAHHALLEVRADGRWITQLAGATPITIAGVPIGSRCPLPLGTPVHIASSTLVLTDEPVPSSSDTHPPAATLRRIVRVAREADTDIDHLLGHHLADLSDHGNDHGNEHEPVPERERPGGLVPTLVGLAGSTVLAVATRRPMFIAFGAIGAAVACSSWLGQWIAFQRRHRRELAAHSARRTAAAASRVVHDALVTAALRRAVPGLANALQLAHAPTAELWARRAAHRDAFVVSAGLASTQPAGRPTIVDLGGRARVALCGPMAHAVARSMVVQLTTQCGPADLRLVVATHAPCHWRWLADLPHMRSDSGPPIVAPDHLADAVDAVAATRSHLVVITDEPDLLAERTSGLRRVLDDTAAHCALLAVLPHQTEAPHICTAVLATHRDGTATWRPHPTSVPPATALVAGLGRSAAAAVAAALASCTDPEDVLGAIGVLPTEVELGELLAGFAQNLQPTARSVALHWTASPDRHDAPLCAPVGVGPSGTVQFDLVRDGPHALVAGTTGSGKSELLRSLVIGLATVCSPHQLSFVLVDYKGGATFDPLARLPHVSGVVTDLDDQLAERMLRSLQAELRRREELLRTFGAVDLTGYRDKATFEAHDDRPPMPRLVVIIDEFAALATERPSFLHALVGIAQRGRSLGVHLVLATQRPGGMVADDIRANTTLRIALRLHDAADALDVVGDRLPTTLPRARPGRAVVRVGGDEPIVVQTARCTDIEHHVDRLVDAAGIAHVHAPPRPWLAPLPAVLGDHDLAPGALGVLDDPDHQRRVPLRHLPTGGPLLVVGSRGAGVTSALVAIATQRRADHPDHAIRVIDANGDQRWSTLDRLHIAQLTTADSDSLVRLLHHLRECPTSATTVIVDGIDELRSRLDTPAHDHRLEHRHETRLEQLVAGLVASIGAGADVVLGATTPAQVPAELLARSARHWVMHLHDPQRAAILGMPASLVPAPVPGRVRVDALLGQLAPPPPLQPVTSTTTPPPAWWLAEPPSTVWTSSLGRPRRVIGGIDAALGIHAIDDSEVRITVDDGEHLMVLGPRGTGRSSALRMLADMLTTTAGATAPPTAPVVVDDAERVDDHDGTLARAVESGAVSVMAAARGDALRHRPGHWTSGVRRSRLAIVLVGGFGDAAADGELLGVSLPRRFPGAVRPGAAWLVDGSAAVPVQLALVRSADDDDLPPHPVDRSSR